MAINQTFLTFFFKKKNKNKANPRARRPAAGASDSVKKGKGTRGIVRRTMNMNSSPRLQEDHEYGGNSEPLAPSKRLLTRAQKNLMQHQLFQRPGYDADV